MRGPRFRQSWSLVVLTSLVGVGPLAGQIAAPVDVRIPAPPSPFAADGMTHLVYELHVTNFATREVPLTGVSALDANTGAVLVEYAGDGFARNVRMIGGTPDSLRPTTLAAGRRAVIFMWATVDPASVPAAITHRLTAVDPRDSTSQVFETEPQAVGEPAVVIGPPLRGEHWLSANGPDNQIGHRRALIPVGGKARIAQRYAIDWVQLIDGSTNVGDRDSNSTYHAWGQDALAVADGVVAAVKDGIPENVPGIDSRAVPITLETIGGNYVIIDIGNGRYAFSAHLQPGSLRVGVGDRVRRGDVIGLVGNSGNSTEPHLHFHVADSPSPLGAEGLPYVFDRFEITGRGGFGEPTRTFDPQPREREIPLANRFVRFDVVTSR